MYEAVHARPDGASTVSRLALTAAEYGYEGIVVRNHGDAFPDGETAGQPAPGEYDAIAAECGVDVVDGVEVRAEDPSRASGVVGNHRADRGLVCVHGGSPAMNRFAVSQPAVDVLAHPMAGDGDLDHVLTRRAAENGVRLELCLADVLRADGGVRVQALRKLRKLRQLVEQYDAPFVVSADPRAHLHLRAPRELVALGDLVGLDADQVRAGLREWGVVADRNRERQTDSFVEPGVRRGAYEGDDGTEERTAESNDGGDEL